MAYPDCTLKLSSGIVYTTTVSGISVTGLNGHIHVNDVRFADDNTGVPITNTVQSSSITFTNNYVHAKPAWVLPVATDTLIRENVGNIGDTVASAATIDLTNEGDVIFLTGGVTVDTINGGWLNRIITIFVDSATTFSAAGNITVAKNIPVNEGIQFVFGGPNWYPLR